MTTTVAAICFVIGCWTSFSLGYKFHARKSVDYKGRWREALEALDTERMKTSSLDEIGAPQPQIEAKSQGRFTLKAEKSGDYTSIKLYDGKELVWKSSNVWNQSGDFAYWIEQCAKEGRKVMKSLSGVAP